MKPVPGAWRAIVSSLAPALLIALSAPLLTGVTAYLMGPSRADPDPAILVILAGLTLVPSAMLAVCGSYAVASLAKLFGAR